MAADTQMPAWQTGPKAAKLSPVRLAIYELCARIPPGSVATYGGLAAALEPNPSARAVGGAMRNNPFSPAPVPCHRVVRSDRSLGGFAGFSAAGDTALRRKVALLQSEGVPVQDGKVPPASLYTFSPSDKAAAAAVRAAHAPSKARGTKRGAAPLSSAPPKQPRTTPALYTSPAELRAAAASDLFTGQTSGQCPGYAQANLVVLPARHAKDFAAFCAANPQACPLLERTPPGVPFAVDTCPDMPSDLRKDVPKYRLHRGGEMVGEVGDLEEVWVGPEGGQDASVAFLLGCSFSFEAALAEAGLPLAHVQAGTNVPMYITNRQTVPAGVFSGPLVVSMRPMTPAQAKQAAAVTAAFPRVHGAPVAVGGAAALGIPDLSKPDFGDPVAIGPGQVPVFWACGVTPQAAIAAAALPDTVATHAPGHMLVLDVTNAALSGPAQGST